ncbi:MAG: hypothetical protein ACOC93_05445 [Planctomycetota bacterium]
MDPAWIEDVEMVTFSYSAAGQEFDQLHVLVGGEEYTFPSINENQVLWTFYDPDFTSPEQIEHEWNSPLDEAWRQELMDGVLDGLASATRWRLTPMAPDAGA